MEEEEEKEDKKETKQDLHHLIPTTFEKKVTKEPLSTSDIKIDQDSMISLDESEIIDGSSADYGGGLSGAKPEPDGNV